MCAHESKCVTWTETPVQPAEKGCFIPSQQHLHCHRMDSGGKTSGNTGGALFHITWPVVISFAFQSLSSLQTQGRFPFHKWKPCEPTHDHNSILQFQGRRSSEARHLEEFWRGEANAAAGRVLSSSLDIHGPWRGSRGIWRAPPTVSHLSGSGGRTRQTCRWL